MHVFLTGGTGYIGSAVLRRLIGDGHNVTALVRSEESAAKVTAAGAKAVTGDITNVSWLANELAGADGAIHTASPGDATSPDVDAAVARAAREAYAGTDKPYVHTGGIWAYGNGEDITETTPFASPPLVAWRESIEKEVLAIPGARPTVVVPGVVYGHGGGIANLISRAPRTETGAFTLIGNGTQHWVTVHVDDLADLYLRVLRNGRAGSYYIASDGTNPAVRALGEAASRAAGTPGAVSPEGPDEARARLGSPFADALLLSQQASGQTARSELGWNPVRPSLIEELQNGTYAPTA
ncbi:NAD-dependent epimerase/dehydratase family protein [Streptomyces sp. MI02-7b]|uniref:NAD-dependent epimerase/dehydratase family protein n=1 Tax=Streptomyces sp. MI02-7b TaxID=462941 RepID=UPI0029AA836F|nr:NAD-dependent epimerase/dehydratase family protein [Streptomyces sp. MI02-7b]MDX3077878.1 NAD-dependent epimerase/dehydratase family protein [Streptomyces sp. MI02-7b]